jgi:inositol-phosphate phosphatase / L-galactose 1-phosphate phosphatase / histidinol-phosphatase
VGCCRRSDPLTLPKVSNDLNDLTRFAEHLAGIARPMLLEAASRHATIETKSDRSFVTATDKAIEQRLRREIAERYPEHGIIGEEEGRERESASVQWVLDPLDGTAPFIAGVPVFGTLIALAIDDTPVIGVMDFPMTNDRMVGQSGALTLHNGKPCRTRNCTTLDKAIMATMNPDFFSDHETAALDRLRSATAWRIYGTSSFGHGQLARGRIDLAFDTRLAIHDFAVYRPIIEGAGGVVTDWQGSAITLRSGPQVLAAGSQGLHRQALEQMKA